jgi:hypothetical protein
MVLVVGRYFSTEFPVPCKPEMDPKTVLLATAPLATPEPLLLYLTFDPVGLLCQPSVGSRSFGREFLCYGHYAISFVGFLRRMRSNSRFAGPEVRLRKNNASATVWWISMRWCRSARLLGARGDTVFLTGEPVSWNGPVRSLG